MAYTTIDKPSSYFNTITYTGTSATNSRTVGFQPDFFWFKNRGGNYHVLGDSIRGITKFLYSNDTSAEVTNTTVISSLDSTGYTLGNNSNASERVNSSPDSMVAWNWLAGGTAVSNTSGTITSTVSANTTSGFSIVSYTGTGSNATIGHGLGVAPAMVIIKDRDTSVNWSVNNQPLNASLGDYTRYLTLDATSAVSGAGNTQYQNSAFTSTVFNVGTNTTTNNNTKNFIAYCFASIKSFSKIGIYTGNGSTDGTFIYTGFKPAYIMTKRSDTAGSGWVLLDNKRNAFNPENARMEANSSGAEATDINLCDFISNGFKFRDTNSIVNASGGTYIYMAFADSPFVSSKAIPTTAR